MVSVSESESADMESVAFWPPLEADGRPPGRGGGAIGKDILLINELECFS